MAGGEEGWAVGMAQLDGRMQGMETTLRDIQNRMSTREGADSMGKSIEQLRVALQLEVTARAQQAKEIEVSFIQRDKELETRIKEVDARITKIQETQESRKYNTTISMIVAGIGLFVALFGEGIASAIRGG